LMTTMMLLSNTSFRINKTLSVLILGHSEAYPRLEIWGTAVGG